MSPIFYSKTTAVASLRLRIADLRKEIELAREKRTGIEKAIAHRMNTIARLEAQLALASSAPAAPMDS